MTKNGQNPVVFYLRSLLYMFVALLLRLIAFAPLACLLLDGAWKWLWVLCPVMVIFGILPLRYSFAQAMMLYKAGKGFSFDKALNLCDYTEKLRESLVHLLHVIKWALPLAVLGVCGYVWYTQVDAITVLRSVTELGGAAAKAAGSVAAFFGRPQTVVAAGTLVEGLYVVGAVIALAVLVWLYGILRNSASRYLWALAASNDRVPSADRRRRLKGRRWQQLGMGLINLALLVPFGWAVLSSLKETIASLSNQLMLVLAGSLPSLDLGDAAVPMLLAFLVLYMPLLPIRRWMTATFAAGGRREKAGKASEL